jgi:ribonuclease P protein component
VLGGVKVSATTHFVLHRCVLNSGTSGLGQPPTGSPLKAPLFSTQDVWVGAMVPKRWAKRAVTRNSIKRQIYTVSSEFEPVLPVAAHVVRLRNGFDRSKFVSASSDVLKTAVRGELVQLFSNATQAMTAIKSSRAPR